MLSGQDDIDPYDFAYRFNEFAAEKGLAFDPDAEFPDDGALDEHGAAFAAWLKQNDAVYHEIGRHPCDTRAKYFFDKALPLPEGSWVIALGAPYTGFLDNLASGCGLGGRGALPSKRVNLDDEASPYERVYVMGFRVDDAPFINRRGERTRDRDWDSGHMSLVQVNSAVMADRNERNMQVFFPLHSEVKEIDLIPERYSNGFYVETGEGHQFDVPTIQDVIDIQGHLGSATAVAEFLIEREFRHRARVYADAKLGGVPWARRVVTQIDIQRERAGLDTSDHDWVTMAEGDPKAVVQAMQACGVWRRFTDFDGFEFDTRK